MSAEEVLIVGAGVVGAPVAYHLTELGHGRVTVLDARARDALPGSTGPAPGFVGQLSATPEPTGPAEDSVATHRAPSRTAPAESFRQVGCLEIAAGPARPEQAHRDVGHGRAPGIEARVPGPADTVAPAPEPVDAERALGALHILPSGGAADPAALDHALADAAEGRRPVPPEHAGGGPGDERVRETAPGHYRGIHDTH